MQWQNRLLLMAVSSRLILRGEEVGEEAKECVEGLEPTHTASLKFPHVVSGEPEQYVFWSIYPVHLSCARTNLSKDSMGNAEILKRGDLQLTSAGTGISHSEKAHGGNQLHLLQIWSLPATARLQPKYFTQHFTDEEKTDKWAKVVAPVWADGAKDTREGEGPAPVQSALTLYASNLGKGKALSRPLEGKKAYVHVIQTSGYNERQASGASVKFSTKGGDEVELRERETGLTWTVDVKKKGAILEVENVGDRAAELVIDLE